MREGRFASASEAVQAGLRPLEIEEEEYDRIRDALRQGEASGAPAPFDWDDFTTEVRATAS